MHRVPCHYLAKFFFISRKGSARKPVERRHFHCPEDTELVAEKMEAKGFDLLMDARAVVSHPFKGDDIILDGFRIDGSVAVHNVDVAGFSSGSVDNPEGYAIQIGLVRRSSEFADLIKGYVAGEIIPPARLCLVGNTATLW